MYPEYFNKDSPLSPMSRESLKSPKSPIFFNNQGKLGQESALFKDNEYMNEIDLYFLDK